MSTSKYEYKYYGHRYVEMEADAAAYVGPLSRYVERRVRLRRSSKYVHTGPQCEHPMMISSEKKV